MNLFMRHLTLVEGKLTGSSKTSIEDAVQSAIANSAPLLPAGYVVSASWIADRRISLAGYRLADLLNAVKEINTVQSWHRVCCSGESGSPKKGKTALNGIRTVFSSLGDVFQNCRSAHQAVLPALAPWRLPPRLPDLFRSLLMLEEFY